MELNRSVTLRAAGEPPEAVSRYLKRAAGRNARLRAELHGDLHQRMLDHLCAGQDAEAAWQAALQDFGPLPGPALLGTLRRVLLPLALGGLLGGAAYAAHLGLL